jgi:hypothetical protein
MKDGAQTQKPPLRLWMIAPVLGAALLAIALLGPSVILSRWANQEFDPSESDIAKISAESSRVSPLLDGFALRGVKIFPRGDAENPITIDEVSARGLSRKAFFKLIAGSADDETWKILENGSLSVRGFAQNQAKLWLEGVSDLSFSELTLSGVSLSEAALCDFAQFSAKNISLTGFAARAGAMDQVWAELFAVSGVKNGVVGSLELDGASIRGGGAFLGRVSSVRAKNADLRAALAGLGRLSAPELVAAVFEGTESFAVASLTSEFAGQRLASADGASWTRGANGAGPLSVSIKNAEIHPDILRLAPARGPLRNGLLEALARDFVFSLEFEDSGEGPRRALSLTLENPENLSLAFSGEVQSLDPEALLREGCQAPPPLLPDGPGSLTIWDRGLFRRLSAARSPDELLAWLRDSPELSRLLDAGALEALLRRFLADPRSLSLSWLPSPEAGAQAPPPEGGGWGEDGGSLSENCA